MPKHSIVTAVAGRPTPTLSAFREVLRGLPHGARVPLEYLTFSDRHRRKNAILHMDRQWWVRGCGVGGSWG